jgi:aspartyl-tRNA(Asn)/glutamyl-tRNA(Gln) amidotransferase subunit A
MTRTVRDGAMMLNVIAGADVRDRLSWSSGIDYERDLDAGVRGLRIAWSPTLGYAQVASDVLENTERAAMAFRELGCEVEPVDPSLPDPANILDVMWSGSLAGYFVDRIDEVRHLLDPGLLSVVERAVSLSAADMAHALQQRNTYYTGMRQFMERFDLLLTPTLPVTAFTAGLDEPDGWQRATLAPLDWTPFTFPFNLTGQPAATVPCGVDRNGLPVGLQIVGRWRDDSTVLRAAAALEAAMPWTDFRPPLEPRDDLVR